MNLEKIYQQTILEYSNRRELKKSKIPHISKEDIIQIVETTLHLKLNLTEILLKMQPFLEADVPFQVPLQQCLSTL